MDLKFTDACLTGNLPLVTTMVEGGWVDLFGKPKNVNDTLFSFGVNLAVEGGHIPVVTYLLTHPAYQSIVLPPRVLGDASTLPNTDMLEHLLFDERVRHRVDINQSAWLLLYKAVTNENIVAVKLLFTDKRLSPPLSVHTNDDLVLTTACDHGALEIVRYVLSSPDLPEHANIHVLNDLAVGTAMFRGHVEIVDYLLRGKGLHDHADIHNHPNWKDAIKGEDGGGSHAMGLVLAHAVTPKCAYDHFCDEKELVEGLYEGWDGASQQLFLDLLNEGNIQIYFGKNSVIEAHRSRQKLCASINIPPPTIKSPKM